MQSQAKSVSQYLAELPADRRTAIQALREVILANIDENVEETMQYGMIGYVIPHRVYPEGYHVDPTQPLPYACLASQKNYISLYVMGTYAGPEEERWLRDAWAAAGQKLDMGKCCIRMKSLDNAPLDVIAEMFRRCPTQRLIDLYESVLKDKRKRPATKTSPPKKAVAKKAVVRKKAPPRKAPK